MLITPAIYYMSKTVALYVAMYVRRWLPVGVELLCKSACHVLTLASIYKSKCTTEKNVWLYSNTVGSPTDRKFLYANTFLFATEFRLSASTVNLIVTNYIFTQLFQKIKTYYARIFFCFI